MGYKIGIVTLGSSGSKTINLGTPSTPFAASFIVQNKAGTAESIKHVSIGSADGAGQRVTSYFKDTGAPSTFDTTTKCVSHYEKVGGVVTEILSATFTAFTATGLTVNVTIPNVNYDVYLRADY